MGDMADYYLDSVFCDDDDDEFAEERQAQRRKEHRKRCKGKPIERTNKTTGVVFIGCSKFPECRYSESNYWREEPEL